jgi:glycosyltransferase involved in cell wall biosynthesis
MVIENPKVSVVIPVRNAEGTISRCIEAVFSQSMKPFEVVMVDGHSTDKTVEMAKNFPVKVVYENYGTIGGARQVGLENAAGDYIASTDADCVPEKDWLKNLINEFDDNIIGVGGGIRNIGSGLWGKSIAIIMNTFVGSANSVQGRLFKEKRFVKSISGCNSSYRRETLMKIGGYNVNLSINEETELNDRLTKNGKLLYTPNAVVLHDQGRGLKNFAKRTYQFGRGRGRLRLWDLQCIPPIIALLLVVSLLFTPWIFVSLISLYAVILLVIGSKYAVQERDIRYLGSIPVVYATEHSSYTIGFLRGLFKV